NAGTDEYLLELVYAIVVGGGVWDLRAGVEGDEIHLGTQAAKKIDDFLCVLNGVILPGEKNVFEGQTLSVLQRKSTSGGEQLSEVPFLVDRHYARAITVIARIQGDRKFRPDRLTSKVVEARNDAGGGDGHARFRDPDIFHEQSDGFHEVLVIEER